jgi:hypothetical protein
MRRTAAAIFLALSAPALGQDVPGLELCTAEKQMDRRTGCLQSNDDYLQQQMLKYVRETQAKLAASSRELAASRAEISALKSKVDSLSGELAALKAKVDSGARR